LLQRVHSPSGIVFRAPAAAPFFALLFLNQAIGIHSLTVDPQKGGYVIHGSGISQVVVSRLLTLPGPLGYHLIPLEET